MSRIHRIVTAATGWAALIGLGAMSPTANAQDFEIRNGWQLEPQNGTFYENGVGSPTVAYNSALDEYVMFFETQLPGTHPNCPVGLWGIGVATSPTGLAPWTVQGDWAVITPESETYFSCVAAHPTVVVEDDETYGVYFKAEQYDNACAESTPEWGCDRYTGVGYAVIHANDWVVDYPRSTPEVSVGAGFGYPSIILLNGDRLMLLARSPELYMAEKLDGENEWSELSLVMQPSVTTWTQDEIFNSSLICQDPESAFPYEVFVGGRVKDNDGTIIGGGWGQALSDDGSSWNMGGDPYFTLSDDDDWRHWDALRVDTEYLVYFSEKNTEGKNRIGFASSVATWDKNDISDKRCGSVPTRWYLDADGDGYGSKKGSDKTEPLLVAPTGYVATKDDCDDSDATVYPGAPELCDGIDNDCANGKDDGGACTGCTALETSTSSYMMCSDEETRADAKAACTSMGYDMLKIEDSSEDTWIRDTLGTLGVYNAWTGLTDEAVEQTWVWDDGSTATYTDWHSGNPGNDVTENCSVVYRTAEDKGWKDKECGSTYPYWCETCVAKEWFADSDGDGYGDARTPSAPACTAPSGYVDNSTDCNDDEPTIYPGAPELCDGQLNDCDGSMLATEMDEDGDQYVECTIDPGGWDGIGSVTEGVDCDDDDDTSIPTSWYPDLDGDGYGDAGSPLVQCTQPSGYLSDGTDCDDTDATVHPGATELCDGQLNDCDGTKLAGEIDADADQVAVCTLDAGGWDGVGTVTAGDDCDDTDYTVYAGATELCDGQLNDCDGSMLVDEVDGDGDGFVGCVLDGGGWDGVGSITAGGDCDDSDAGNTPTAWNVDLDGDGYGSTTQVYGCTQPSGTSGNSTDCDDTDATVYPAATELCDGQLNDCDGSMLAGEVDADSDQYVVCSLDAGGWDGAGTVTSGDDCNDSDATAYPGATELCDGQLNDCDGTKLSGEIDDDGDQYVGCTLDAGGWDGTGTVVGGDDCNDGDASEYPGGTEVCDGLDNDCSGQADEGMCSGAITAYHGDHTYLLFTSNKSWSDASADCIAKGYRLATIDDATEDAFIDDTMDSNGSDDAWIGLTDAASEGTWVWEDGTPMSYTNWKTDEPNGGDDDDCGRYEESSDSWRDYDCDNGYDYICESCVRSLWYTDADGDGYGDPSSVTSGCTQPAGAITVGGDCDDTDATVYPSASELCDGQLNDCDGSMLAGEVDSDGDQYVVCTLDAGGWDGGGTVVGGNDCDDGDAGSVPTTWYADADGDSYGDSGTTALACTAPGGYLSNSTDCDDTDATVYPAATELCDGQLNDCDGTKLAGEVDADGDQAAVCTLDAGGWDGPGTVVDGDDCDDTDATVYPAATELCDGQLNDCDGSMLSTEVDTDSDQYVECTLDAGGWDGPGTVTAGDDCDDSDAFFNPGALETCDGRDNNCSGQADEGSVCSCDVVYYGSHAYMMCTSNESWDDAKSACAASGYDLATIDDASEDAFIQSTMDSYGSNDAWIGLTDAASEGTWVWDDGTPMSYTNWKDGEPNGGDDDDCGRYEEDSSSWRDYDCDNDYDYICENTSVAP